ncbi:hypothetical protein MTBBW1_1040049 [Desulfamplus magnetovallimortis]|uniref:AAA+ ATPase domain-containing protein n=1 Tax=Desulfamplus magnetovallimortis TaxID=1246637 RepID=A0A1W1H573_9BACT|nr:ATP-binding protein [Desulfamplus magnetovallimortis]SLM27592.1 hypothetical protein MTBBW1_1040049 [Desulfamplus magnetovallimortis]
MDTLKPFTNEPAFLGRSYEMDFLQSWIVEKPKNILFLYGPKSSGKTTLLYKFIEQNLNNIKYDIKHFNLRRLLLINYESFLRAFFELKTSEQVKEQRQYDLKVFKLSVETIKGLELKDIDPFIVMARELQKQVKKAKRPIIIIDELQALDEIYFNGDRELLKEMFNFFVAMTKESHLCHVIIASSDGYFIDRIYNDSRLKKTSEFLEVDYLGFDDVMEWLANLEKYSKIDEFVLTDFQKQVMWDFFGGSCWEISNFLGHLLMKVENARVSDKDFHDILEVKRIACRSMFAEYATIIPKKRALLKEIAKVLEHKRVFTPDDIVALVEQEIWQPDDMIDELNRLVQRNYLSYAPPRAEYALQGRSMEIGICAYVEMISSRQI